MLPLASLAEFEPELIRERVKAGMYRAAKEDKKSVGLDYTTGRGFDARYKTVLEWLNAGNVSRRKAAKELGLGYSTLKRLLDAPF